jgi:hypothetical protein
MDFFLERPGKQKTDLRFGTWNVRCLCRAVLVVASDLRNCKLDLKVVKGVRWDKAVKQKEILYFSMEMGTLIIA